MKTTTTRRSGFALGTVMVLALIMLAAVGALLGFAVNESRSAFRNQLATSAFHRAEQGIELAIDALARDVHKSAASGWNTVAGAPITRYKKTLSTGDSKLVIYVDDMGGNTYSVRSRATITQSDSLTASRAILTRFVSSAGTTSKPGNGPGIYGNILNLGANANSDDTVNRYGQFKSRYGKPVWNPRRFYPNSGTTTSLWTVDEKNNAITNCFDGFRIESPATTASGINIYNSYIYGHVATTAPNISYLYESSAPSKPSAWIGEDLAPSTSTNSWAAEKRPYSSWTELPDAVVYGTHPTYASADADKYTTVDGKCIEQGLPALDTSSWLVTPVQPTVKTVGTGANTSVVIDTVGSSSLASGTATLAEQNSAYETKFTPTSQTITWPRNGTESAAIIRVQDFEANNTTKFVINGPVTLLATGSNLKLNSSSITFGPKGSLTIYYNGGHMEMDRVKTLAYTPLRDANDNLLTDQTAALASSTTNYNPDKLLLNCSATSGDIVIHVNDSNPMVTAKIVAPSMDLKLHAASARSTFIGQLIGKLVETTNNFDFFYDIDNGGGGGDGTAKTWSISLWRQIQPQTVTDSMPSAS